MKNYCFALFAEQFFDREEADFLILRIIQNQCFV